MNEQVRTDEQKTFEEFASVGGTPVADIHAALNVWRAKHGLHELSLDTVRKRTTRFRTLNNIEQHRATAPWTPDELETIDLLVGENMRSTDVYVAFKKVHPKSGHPESSVYDKFVRVRRSRVPVKRRLREQSGGPSVTQMRVPLKLVGVAQAMREVFVERMGVSQATDANYMSALDLCAYLVGLKR